MSDTPHAPGWWQASDGKWYPPESTPAMTPAPPNMPPPHVVAPSAPAEVATPLAAPEPVMSDKNQRRQDKAAEKQEAKEHKAGERAAKKADADHAPRRNWR